VSVIYFAGSSFTVHAKANIDPLFSHCCVCGKSTKQPRYAVGLNFDGELEVGAGGSNGWRFAVGSECAKKFDSAILEMVN
jgi:hypothetical protein